MCASPPNIPKSRGAISRRAASRPNASSSTAPWSWRRARPLRGRSSIWSQTGATLRANGLVEIERIADITSRFIVNRAALKTRPAEIDGWIERFREAASCRVGSRPRRESFAADVRFAAFWTAKREAEADVDAVVAAIVDDRRQRGDAALIDYTRRFDRLELDAGDLARPGRARSSPQRRLCAAETSPALRLAAIRIEAYHRHQLPADFDYHRCGRRDARLALATARRRSGSTCRAAPRPIPRRC